MVLGEGMAASAVAAVGGRVIGKNGTSSWIRIKDRKGLDRNGTNKVCCLSSPAVLDPYKTLRIHPGASESEVKKAFRQLALQYHPDVCRGSNCLVQFQEINHAYDMVMNDLQGESEIPEMMGCNANVVDEEIVRGMCDPDWEPWEEWMGWEGAGIRDYSSHINPYI